ncbi:MULTISPECIES: hypothetical protein [unclassified Acidiphilium]|jgi:hypothetical protein|uniref:flavodoxin family protein n=1 Tax=unclassified Acidiphilium TaxID=2617493 RepID=UPI000BDC09DF|nr:MULTISPECIES: hypothetical protein [unclassified Acidiphilium]OYV56380.1 MAG: hypothetical protein B7Z76_05595 [Acidiphilium sp. 20-67-58]OYV86052.1 MAG: hypothetical protein B7Z64_04310 [Acidiphilium sp. 21-68-69]HQT59943.1 hypothetical protein [Acidiphilium sp.]
MRVLVVYYSRTGTTARIASMIAGEFGADLETIRCPACAYGIPGAFRALGTCLGGHPPEILPTTINPAKYELLILGTPVWAFSLAAPLRAWLAVRGRNLPACAAFATASATGFRSTFAAIETLTGQTLRATLAITAEDICAGREHLATLRFADTLRETTTRLWRHAPPRAAHRHETFLGW